MILWQFINLRVLMVDGLKTTTFSSAENGSSKIFFDLSVCTGRYRESGVISLGVGWAVGEWVDGTGGLYSITKRIIPLTD